MNITAKHRTIRRLFLPAIGVILVAFLVCQGNNPTSAAETEKTSQESVSSPKAANSESELDLSPQLPHWMRREVLGIALWQFVLAFISVLLGLVLKKVSDHFFEKKLIPMFQKTRFAFDNLLVTAASKPLGYLFLLGGVGGAFAVLPLPSSAGRVIFGALKVFLIADVLWFLFRSVDVAVAYLTRLAQRTDSKLDNQLIPLIRKALKVTIGIVCFLWVIQNLGFSVSSLLAGLGIGGLAVALAFQDTLANFFGSVFIFLDKPFAVGDWIKVGDVEGIVEDVGFRSTRIRTFPKSLVSIPNKTVAGATIDNCSKMPKRRVSHTVGVTYDTTPQQMEQAVAAIHNIVKSDEGVDNEYIVVRFTEFGDSSLNILVYYFTTAVGFADHVATKERINLAIMRALENLGLSIAFPTRTVYLEGDIAKQLGNRFVKSEPEMKPRSLSPPASEDEK